MHRPEMRKKLSPGYKRSVRAQLRINPPFDPLERPIRGKTLSDLFYERPGAWRTVVKSGDWDAPLYNYSIVRDEYDDETLDEAANNMRIEIRSPYDCTGQPFTHWIHWNRTPAGVVFVHCIGLDV